MKYIFRNCAVMLAGALIWIGAFALGAPPAAAQQGFFTPQEIANAPTCGTYPKGQTLYLCKCPAGFARGAVWGSGPYTGDSNICTAAQHAGAVTAQGGTILAMGAPGQASYAGSQQNGVTTGSWGSYGNSYFVRGLQQQAQNSLPACGKMPSGVDSYQCSCGANTGQSGPIWGSGPYTADSDLCAAALHSGAITSNGGAINVMRLQGLDHYTGSFANGVKTSDWGRFGSSVVLNRN